MALSLDGAALVFGTRNSIPQPVIAALELDGSGSGASNFTYTYPALGNTSYLRDFAIANDGKTVFVVADDVSASRPAYLGPSRVVTGLPPGPIPGTTQPPPLVQLLATGNANPNLFYDGAVGASLDGSRVLIASSVIPPGSNLHDYNGSTGVLSDTGLAIAASSVQLDREGTRVLLSQKELYAANLASMGMLPAGTLAATLSADGTRAYTYDGTDVRSFDISAAAVVALNTRAASGSAGDPAKRHVMTITPDGQTLFIAGSAAVLVEPIP
jgi:hypothetical protein